ncbi:MAG: ferritin [Puniceicoccales bacterium]|nr:ferritin [Puniceicoccales bacterium]
MIIEKKLLDLFLEQIRNELESAYKYLGMSAYFESTPYKGFAKWMRKQAIEETEHAIKLFDYVNERGNHVELFPLEPMPTHYASPLEVFQETLNHERQVTHLISEMYVAALEVRDFAAQIFLQWYITEQVEEERQAQDILDLIEVAADNTSALMGIDRQVSQRED